MVVRLLCHESKGRTLRYRVSWDPSVVVQRLQEHDVGRTSSKVRSGPAKRTGWMEKGDGEGATLGRTPKGSYSLRRRSRHLLETPFLEPLLRTLLRTSFYRKTHSRPPSKNPSENLLQNPFQNLRTPFSEP